MVELGMDPFVFVEISPKPRKVQQRRWPVMSWLSREEIYLGR